MNCEELHASILKTAVLILAGGEEASPVLFCVNEEKEEGHIISLGEVFDDKDLAAAFIKVAAKATQATLVGMVNEGWASKSVAEGKVPYPKEGLESMPDAMELLVITIESKAFSRMWLYPIHRNDDNQRVLDIEDMKYMDDSKEGVQMYNRFSVFGRDNKEALEFLLPGEGGLPS